MLNARLKLNVKFSGTLYWMKRVLGLWLKSHDSANTVGSLGLVRLRCLPVGKIYFSELMKRFRMRGSVAQ